MKTILDNQFTPIKGNMLIQTGTIYKINPRQFASCSKTEYTLKCEHEVNSKKYTHYITYESWNSDFNDSLSDSLNVGDLVEFVGTVRNGNYKKKDGTWAYGYTNTLYQVKILEEAIQEVNPFTEEDEEETFQADWSDAKVADTTSTFDFSDVDSIDENIDISLDELPF